jgi:hypothetical protein
MFRLFMRRYYCLVEDQRQRSCQWSSLILVLEMLGVARSVAEEENWVRRMLEDEDAGGDEDGEEKQNLNSGSKLLRKARKIGRVVSPLFSGGEALGNYPRSYCLALR